GTQTLPMNKDGIGICHHGIQQCTTPPLPPGDPNCPPGWPAGKTCPRQPPSYGACTGLQAPLKEVCNGADDDCDGTIDNNLTDPWADPTNPNYPTAHPCCSTGNLADCTNTGTGTRCQVGGFVCQMGAKICLGSVAKTIEVCNGIDDDCNGIIDDVPGVGTPCTGPGIYTAGECTARLECVAGNAAPVCVQKKGPMPEV